MARFLLILMLVWQPLTLQTAGASTRSESATVAMDCCRVVESVGCCAKPALETRCAMTGGVCRCGLAPVQPKTPEPAIPTTRPIERTLAAMPLGGVIVVAPSRAPRVARAGVQERPSRSHNTSQAILGIWRT